MKKNKKKAPKTQNKASRIHNLVYFLVLSLLVIGCTPDDDLQSPASFQERYIGTWDCEETTGINAPQFYTINISAGAGEDELIIKNLYGEPTQLNAFISGLNLSIPSQSTMGITISGSGQANADFEQIIVNFSASDGASTDQVRAILRPN